YHDRATNTSSSGKKKQFYAELIQPSKENIDDFNSFYGSHAFENFFVKVKKAEHSESWFCNGDSGGPAFVNLNHQWVLVGIIQGFHSILTQSPTDTNKIASCEDGLGLLTSLGQYVDWLNNTLQKNIETIH
ncbi:MAG: hypothetical protein K2X39_07475, partial [Silvanigrellaceae bacterium]|nr:hypothetical protein [Silvanigrellaceae bacterium]